MVGVVWRLIAFATAWLLIMLVALPLVGPELPWTALPSLLGALLVGALLLRMDRRPPSALGFALRRDSGSGVALGLLLGVAVGLLAVALIAAAGGVRWLSDDGSWIGWLGAGAGTLWLLAIPAAAEEAMLRGYPLVITSEAWGAAPAILLTSVVFALLHLGNPEVGWVGLTNIAAAGLFLGALCLRTGGLWWPTGAHLGWNWAHAFLVDMRVSGLELVDAPLLEPRTSGPAWLSGGAFGPEGSVLATVAVLAATAWIWRTRFFGAPGARAASPQPEEH
jgi:membrane protease YdiL (CAAX protease family)